MSKSRYADTPLLDGNHYATFSLPNFTKGYRALDLLEGVRYQEYTWKFGDRFDKLAARFFNQDEDWWLICLCNDIFYPWGMQPGDTIRIPIDANDVKRKILK